MKIIVADNLEAKYPMTQEEIEREAIVSEEEIARRFGPKLPVVFVCISQTLTDLQVADLHKTFGEMSTELATHEDCTQEQVTCRKVVIVLASPALKAKTSAIPATATLAEVQALAKEVVLEALACEATHFVCMGEPTLALWANLYASNHFTPATEGDVWRMTCLAPVADRAITHVKQEDGATMSTIRVTHVQWRPIF